LRAVVLAAGRGERLGAATLTRPKPLWRLGSAPILDQDLALLAAAGVSHVAINLHHLGSAIRDHVDQQQYGAMSITYSEEETLLGTAGGVRKAQSLLPSTWPVLVIYGDNLLRLDLRRMMERHDAAKGQASIAVHWQADARMSGLIEFSRDGRIESFVEKPQGSRPIPGWVNAGVYLLEKSVIDAIPVDRPTDFGLDIFPGLVRGAARLVAHKLGAGESVLAIDTPERYEEALRVVDHLDG
jgi:NDP-sugar pyrophosphorylase family protein